MADTDRSRGLLTDNDRGVLQQDFSDASRPEKRPLYNVRAAIRNRAHELLIDLRLLQHRQPDLLAEIAPYLRGVKWADPETTYSADIEEDMHEVLINGEEPLPPRTDIADPSKKGRFKWGGTGAGEKQLAIALLAHATDPGLAEDYHVKFYQICTTSLNDQWELTAEKIQAWVRKLENAEGEIELEQVEQSVHEAKRNELNDFFRDQQAKADVDISEKERDLLHAAAKELVDSAFPVPDEE